MSFAGIIFVCWLGIAGVAFLALSGLGRLAAREDVESDLGIVGDAELRMLVGERHGEPSSPEARLARFGTEARLARFGAEARLARFGASGAHAARMHEGAGYAAPRYAGARRAT